jgi:uncharacterized protein YacL
LTRELDNVLNSIIKFSFAAVGCITGITITRTFFIYQLTELSPELKTLIFLVVAVALGIIFYMGSNKLIDMVMETLDKLELLIQRLTLYELTISSIGLIVGLVIANLVTIPIKDIDIIGTPFRLHPISFSVVLALLSRSGRRMKTFSVL